MAGECPDFPFSLFFVYEVWMHQGFVGFFLRTGCRVADFVRISKLQHFQQGLISAKIREIWKAELSAGPKNQITARRGEQKPKNQGRGGTGKEEVEIKM